KPHDAEDIRDAVVAHVGNYPTLRDAPWHRVFDLVEAHPCRRIDVQDHCHGQAGRITGWQMANGKEIGRLGTDEPVADEVGGLTIKRRAAHECARNEIRGRGYLI